MRVGWPPEDDTDLHWPLYFRVAVGWRLENDGDLREEEGEEWKRDDAAADRALF